MDKDLTSTSLSDNHNDSKNTLYVIFIIIAIIVLYFYLNKKIENMTGGTLTQLFANDSQDTYLKGNVDNLATGKFNLYWNQPTRLANTFLNRGSPLPSTKNVETSNVMLLPNQSNNKITLNDIANINSEEIEEIEYNKNNNLSNNIMNGLSSCQKCNGQCNNPKSCLQKCKTNPSSCGGGAGGYRLETGFIDATTSPISQKIDENIVYPDSYVGSYFINPQPDIMQPYPVIINRV